jgi:hypothetical protein
LCLSGLSACDVSARLGSGEDLVFHVEAAGEFRPVQFTFASESEVRRVRSWRKMTPATDAGEFAALAAKRWFYYTREGASVASLDEMRAAIKRNERAELAFLMVATAEWAARYKFLALANCRRTWCHHLALDFLAVRPGLRFAGKPISGIGSGVFASLADMAYSLGMETMWGEATASSAPFYEKILRTRPVKDLFIIQRDTMRGVREYYLADQQSRLAKTDKSNHTS